MHGGGTERRSYQPLRLASYTRVSGPASARLIGSGSCVERCSFQHLRLACFTGIIGPASARLVWSGPSTSVRPAIPEKGGPVSALLVGSSSGPERRS